jgi:hypothetical protein
MPPNRQPLIVELIGDRIEGFDPIDGRLRAALYRGQVVSQPSRCRCPTEKKGSASEFRQWSSVLAPSVRFVQTPTYRLTVCRR